MAEPFISLICKNAIVKNNRDAPLIGGGMGMTEVVKAGKLIIRGENVE
jgi:hypothetical protein